MKAPRINASNYRTWLRQILEQRCAKNPRYSLRAFARDLGLAANRLSEILKAKQGISPAVAQGICQRLEMSLDDRELFCDMVLSEHARSRSLKEAAQKRVREYLDIKSHYQDLALDQFRVISEWYHLATMEILKLKNRPRNYQQLAKALSISLPESNSAVERLLRLGAIAYDEKGELIETGKNFVIADQPTPSLHILKFHQRMILKAVDMIWDAKADRYLKTSILTIAHNRAKEAQHRLDQFWAEFVRDFDCRDQGEAVYSLSGQFFRISSEGEDEHLPE